MESTLAKATTRLESGTTKRTPLYQVGQRVLHISKGRTGTVHSVINSEDRVDVRLQGYRYLVQHSGWLWSIPESAMRSRDLPP